MGPDITDIVGGISKLLPYTSFLGVFDSTAQLCGDWNHGRDVDLLNPTGVLSQPNRGANGDEQS